MPCLDDSSISCGVLQWSGFYNDDDDGSGPPCNCESCVEDRGYVAKKESKKELEENVVGRLLQDLCSNLINFDDPDREACVHLMFSDIYNGPGDLFGRAMARKYPRTMAKKVGINPNSGNKIATYLWAVPFKALKEAPEWKKATAYIKRSPRW